MNDSPRPRTWVIASTTLMIVELPAFLIFLLIRGTPNYGPEWQNWPVLTGVFPALFLTDVLKLLPRHLSLPWLRVELSAFTILFAALLFFVSWRTRFWKQALLAGLACSIGLAVLGLLILRA